MTAGALVVNPGRERARSNSAPVVAAASTRGGRCSSTGCPQDSALQQKMAAFEGIRRAV